MKWIKKGLICSSETFNIPWYKKNSMTPVPYLINQDVIRIFLTMCDEDNIGRIGYVDVDVDNPSKIVGYSKYPLLNVGQPGTFDEHGVLSASILKEKNKLYLYYSAYQRQVSIPYAILSGLASSEDNGNSFKKVSNVPVLERTNEELFQRSAIGILKIKDKYRIWYTSGYSWINNGIKLVPKYDIKYTESTDPCDWHSCKSQIAISLKGDEYGLTMPQVFFENGIYKMIYSIRSISKGYRLGYAESKDGILFERQDQKMQIDVSDEGFDSEMICFGKMLSTSRKTYLFYCGNHYGMDGIGYAELIQE